LIRRALLLVLLSIGLVAVPASATEPKQPASPEQIIAYHDSGQWDKDIQASVDKAKTTLDKALAKKVKKPAIVFDIDDTLLSAYNCAKPDNFQRGPIAVCVVTGKQTKIKQTVALYKYAQKKKVAVFLITARPENLRTQTIGHLKAAGLTGYKGLSLRPTNDPNTSTQVPYKSGERKKIQGKGYTIVANLGDQKSDLAGGFGKGYKIPNPMYTTP
jgi:predicted secreted acid phosphatase